MGRLLLAGVMLAALTARVRADIISWVPDVVEPVEDGPPSIRVRLRGESLPPEDVWRTFLLRHAPSAVRLVGVKAVQAIPYHESEETLGIVVLVEGHGSVAGAVYPALRSALRAPHVYGVPRSIPHAGPPGSKGALVVYDEGATTTYDGDLRGLTPDKLGAVPAPGAVLAPGAVTSRNLAAGLLAAHRVLATFATDRKALFVISDGFDAGEVVDFTAIGKAFVSKKVEIFAFMVANPFDEPPSDVASHARLVALAGTAGAVAKVRDTVDLQDALARAVEQINSRFTLVFPGAAIDPKTKRKAGFLWDGREHAVDLFRGDEQLINYASDGTERVTTLWLPRVVVRSRSRPRWPWIVIVGGGLMLGFSAIVLQRRKATRSA